MKHDPSELLYPGSEPLLISQFFQDNIRLRKLDFDATVCDEATLDELMEALSYLDLLEDLTMTLHTERSRPGAKFEAIIAPRKPATEDGPEQVPCPRLTRLSIQYKFQSIGALISVLAERKLLALGYIFDQMRDRSLGTPAPGTRIHRVESCRLKSTELCKITTPDGAVDLLHEFADSVTFRDKPIKRVR